MKTNRVTAEQLAILKTCQSIFDYEKARQMVIVSGVCPSTTFHTEEEKQVALFARYACYNPKDKGKDGKLNEIQKRVDRTNVTGEPMRWVDFNARSAFSPDQKIRKPDGGYWILEHKHGAGDWYRTMADNREEAIKAYKLENKMLVWDTDDFTIIMPFADFIEALESYKGGAETFFKKSMGYNVATGKNVLQLQTYTNSVKKLTFLMELEKTCTKWETLCQTGMIDE